MQYRLRTLVILMAIVPPLASSPYWIVSSGWTVHSGAGVMSAISYAATVLLLARVFQTSNHLIREPPKDSPLLSAALITAIVTVATLLLFFLTRVDPK